MVNKYDQVIDEPPPFPSSPQPAASGAQPADGFDEIIDEPPPGGPQGFMADVADAAGGLATNAAGGAVEALLTLPGAVNDLMLMGVDKVAQQFGAKPLDPEQYANNPFGSETVRGMFKDYVSPDIFGPVPKNKAEEYARRVGEFVGPGAALAPAKLLKPAITAGITGGIGSRAAQDAFPDSALAPVIGGVVGGLTPSAVTAVRNVRAPTAGMTPETAKLAKQMIDEGIPIYPGQVGSKAAKVAYDAVSKVPFVGDKARAKQLRAFNSAVARTFGETADTITPEVMSRAKSRLSQTFEKVFARNDIKADQSLLDDLADIQGRATTNLTDAQATDVGKAISAVLNEVNKGGGVLTGRKYHAFTSKGGALQNLVSSADPNIKFYAGQAREALDDAFARSASNADDVAALKQAKQQYRAMKVVQDLVPKAADGNISPALLLGKIMTNDKGMAYTGGGKLGMLARGGQQLLKEIPGSQTAERQLLYAGLSTGGGYALTSSVAPAVALWAGAKGIKSLLESKKLGARMVAGALMRAQSTSKKLPARAEITQGARVSAPGSISAAGSGQSKRTPALPRPR